MARIDVWIPQEDEQVLVDPRTKSRTIHTGLNYPDGSQGFIIIGRIGNTAWEPLKVISKVIVEYVEDTEVSSAPEGGSLYHAEDTSGQPSDGLQADGLGQGSSVPSGKRRGRPKKGGQDSSTDVGAGQIQA